MVLLSLVVVITHYSTALLQCTITTKRVNYHETATIKNEIQTCASYNITQKRSGVQLRPEGVIDSETVYYSYGHERCRKDHDA